MVDATKDCWEPGGYVYQHYGKRYVTTITDGKVNIGCLETVQKPADSKQGEPQPISKIILDVPDEVPGEEVIMKQRGRPKKTENLSRVTKWRREKEEQGILL